MIGTAVIIYVAGFILTLVIVGWLSDEMDSNNIDIEEVGKIVLISCLWPIFWVISTPILARKIRNGIRRRKALRQEHRIKAEAEAKVLRSKQARSAHLRPIRRHLDLSK